MRRSLCAGIDLIMKTFQKEKMVAAIVVNHCSELHHLHFVKVHLRFHSNLFTFFLWGQRN